MVHLTASLYEAVKQYKATRYYHEHQEERKSYKQQLEDRLRSHGREAAGTLEPPNGQSETSTRPSSPLSPHANQSSASTEGPRNSLPDLPSDARRILFTRSVRFE